MINWRRIPVYKLLFPFILGIILHESMSVFTSLSFWLNIIFGFFILGLIFFLLFQSKRKETLDQVNKLGASILLLTFSLAFVWSSLMVNHRDRLPVEKEFLKIKVNELTKTKRGDKYKAEVEILSGNYGNAVCYFPLDSTLETNTILYIKNKLKPLEHSKNPLAFDYASYLNSQDIFYQGFFTDKDFKVQGKVDRFSIMEFSSSIRESLLIDLKESGVTESQYAIAAAILLGDKSELDDQFREAYSTAGAMHVLAVSGLHVGILFMILQFIMGRYKQNNKPMKWWQAIVFIAFLWSFALITGLGPSVLRAATMFSFVVVGQAMKRQVSIYNSIAASALLLLFIDPFLMFNVGFQLSYLAVLGIVYFQPKIANWIYIKNKYLDYFWQLTAVSIAAQISTLPITLYYFHSFPTYFFLTNLIVIPAAAIIIGLGVAVLLTAFIPLVSGIFGTILNSLLVWLNKGVFFISLLPGSKLNGISINEMEVLFYYALIVLAALTFYTKSGRYFLASLVTILFILVLDIQEDVLLSTEHKLIVWNINKQTAISEIGNHNNVYSTVANRSDLDYSLSNYYAAHDKKIETISPLVKDSLSLIYVNGKKIVIIPQKHSIQLPNEKLKTDILLITDNCPLSLQTFVDQFEFETIIFDASNSEFTAKRYSDEANLLDLHYVNTRESGAYVLDLEKSD